MKKPFYITTTLPYVNADPHIGFAMEVIRADIIARWKREQGFEVFFNTGTDERGAKIFEVAKKAGQKPQVYVNEAAKKFQTLIPLLNLSEPNFIRTTDLPHIKAAGEFWRICAQNGHIYKKPYKIKYCVGCELEKTDSELVNGQCPLHPTRKIEEIEEENYFFRFSAFQKPLLALYEKYPDFVVPAERLSEIKSFVRRGLQDFSISRLKEKMPWGIEVPDDPTQVFYVWFDALVNYISAIGWPGDLEKFRKWQMDSGGMVQYCGKDNLRQQAAMWQAMLMAAGLPPSRQIVIDGFVTGEGGVKMSKSLGNAVSPAEIVNEYGADALRYFVTRELHPFEDSPFTKERFKEAYNANLANGLGNLVSRVLKMAEQNHVTCNAKLVTSDGKKKNTERQYQETIERYDLKSAMDVIWEKIHAADKKIQETEPFKLVKTEPEKARKIIGELLSELREIAKLLLPFLSETAEKILNLIKTGKAPNQPLFPRK
ncbi:MAG TPA: methionine--tRNA ligase [Candidatus Taylorbacteria bacterium]|nr:MAG: Methionyl-tRNA synthetase [Parcubacteria group bacterium GW2011_GWA2_47_64]HBV01128.1 methionine--tRNA ligase [Candidatus Taylorbacteria bacterium]